MARWTTALRESGAAIVTPVVLPKPNPQQAGDAWWVVYPFVEGDNYVGEPGQIEAAGKLLGEIHEAPLAPESVDELRRYEWPPTTRNDVDDDLVTLANRTKAHLGPAAQEAIGALHALGERWWSASLPSLLAADDDEPLPRVGASSDFKANNLVFSDSDVTLVDPDNGGFEPRILDLAKSVVLFHTESPGAPGRLFNENEWDLFASCYLDRVDLTARERNLWPAALDHMLWEEGTWIIEDSEPTEWDDERQAAYLGDLATADPSRYQLP